MISRSFERPDRTVSRASDATNRYKNRYTRTQHRPTSRQVNDHGRVSGAHNRHDIADGVDPADHVADFTDEYNTIRAHQALDQKPPRTAYLLA